MSTTAPKRFNRLPANQKNGTRTSQHPQSGGGKLVAFNNKLRPVKLKQRNKRIRTSRSTSELNLTGLTFHAKLGAEIFSKYKLFRDFSRDQKIEALMVYRCIRHLDGFIDKEFSDVTDAICYVYKEAERLIGKYYSIIYPDGYSKGTIPNDYKLQIIHDVFEDEGTSRWQSYCDIDKVTVNKPSLRKALYMCMHICTQYFNFSIFDKEGDYNIMDIDDWYHYESDNITNSLEYSKSEFFEKYNRDYTGSKKDKATNIGKEIVGYDLDLDSIAETYETYQKKAVPIQRRILQAVPDIDFIKKQIVKHKEQDVAKWMSHILFLNEQEFDIRNYIAESYEAFGEPYDENSISPKTNFGYIYDGDNMYTSCINENFNEIVNNYCVTPFCINTVIDPWDGIIFETSNVPLGLWLNKLFKFSITYLKYEK